MRDSSSVRLIWSSARGPGCGGLGALPPGFLPLAAAQGRAGGELGLVVGLLAQEAFLRPCFDLGLGLGDGRQAVLTALDLFGKTHPVRHPRAVGTPSQLEQCLDLRLELGLDLLGMAIRQGAVPTGVGVDLGAVQTDRPEAAELVLARHFPSGWVALFYSA